MKTAPDQWKPSGIPGMEDAALAVVRSNFAMSVVAGPGAGKTELLAQRVGFLLQTGACASPKRILAISFKRDAATNLRDRVVERAGTLAARFDSFTFDAFSKSIVDRFLPAIPAYLRPPSDYEILSPTKREVQQFLQSLKPPSTLGSAFQVGSLDADIFVRDFVVGAPLPVESAKPTTLKMWAAQELWVEYLKRKPPVLTFPMIGRLAELLLRTLPELCRALQETYKYVLLDEFQDTTHVQYDLIRTAFRGSPAILTAVGDHRQRIMGWAMALKDAFDRFDKDFGAKRKTLLMNYRSSPELVAIQEYLILALDPDSDIPKSARAASGIADHCRILVFPDHEVEARHIASRVARALKQDGITPRDICILVKQKASVYSNAIITALDSAGIRARNESELQDLLAEPVTAILMSFMKLAVFEKAPAEWAVAIETLAQARRVDIESRAMLKIEKEAISIARALNQKLLSSKPTRDHLHDVLQAAIASIGGSNLKAIYPQYRRGTFLRKLLSQLADALWNSYEARQDWKAAMEDVTGKDVLPVMTIHKSKGLEYHTVIFVGLEDSAFWSFKNQSDEDTCAFFVAFSRAKERVLFTFSRQRTTRESIPMESQTASAISPLYDLLKKAGVKTYTVK